MAHFCSTDPKIAFGKKLKQLRLAGGLSQEELASLAGIDRTYVSSCERGHRNVSLEIICRLAQALNVEAAEMFDAAGGSKAVGG